MKGPKFLFWSHSAICRSSSGFIQSFLLLRDFLLTSLTSSTMPDLRLLEGGRGGQWQGDCWSSIVSSHLNPPRDCGERREKWSGECCCLLPARPDTRPCWHNIMCCSSPSLYYLRELNTIREIRLWTKVPSDMTFLMKNTEYWLTFWFVLLVMQGNGIIMWV